MINLVGVVFKKNGISIYKGLWEWDFYVEVVRFQMRQEDMLEVLFKERGNLRTITSIKYSEVGNVFCRIWLEVNVNIICVLNLGKDAFVGMNAIIFYIGIRRRGWSKDEEY